MSFISQLLSCFMNTERVIVEKTNSLNELIKRIDVLIKTIQALPPPHISDKITQTDPEVSIDGRV